MVWHWLSFTLLCFGVFLSAPVCWIWTLHRHLAWGLCLLLGFWIWICKPGTYLVLPSCCLKDSRITEQGLTWMSQGPSSHSDDDEISLAVQFQGLNITIQGQGPALACLGLCAQALSRLISCEDSPHQCASFTTECPDQYPQPVPFLLRNVSSGLGKLAVTPRQNLLGHAGAYPEESVVDIDLPSNCRPPRKGHLRAKDPSQSSGVQIATQGHPSSGTASRPRGAGKAPRHGA